MIPNGMKLVGVRTLETFVYVRTYVRSQSESRVQTAFYGLYVVYIFQYSSQYFLDVSRPGSRCSAFSGLYVCLSVLLAL